MTLHPSFGSRRAAPVPAHDGEPVIEPPCGARRSDTHASNTATRPRRPTRPRAPTNPADSETPGPALRRPDGSIGHPIMASTSEKTFKSDHGFLVSIAAQQPDQNENDSHLRTETETYYSVRLSLYLQVSRHVRCPRCGPEQRVAPPTRASPTSRSLAARYATPAPTDPRCHSCSKSWM